MKSTQEFTQEVRELGQWIPALRQQVAHVVPPLCNIPRAREELSLSFTVVFYGVKSFLCKKAQFCATLSLD